MSAGNPIQKAREVIKARTGAAKMFGYGADLEAVVSAFDELERRCGVLAEVYLLMYEQLRAFDAGSRDASQKVHGAVLQSLGEMNDHAGIIARRITHPRGCVCELCMGKFVDKPTR